MTVASGDREHYRRFGVIALLILAAVVGAVAIASIWAKREVLDTDGWVHASSRALADRSVRDGVSEFLADEVDNAARKLVGKTGEVGEVAADELRPQVRELAERAIASHGFVVVWAKASAIAHRAVVRVLEEKGRSEGDGRVVLDLGPALREIAASLGGKEVVELLPPGAADVEILEAHELETAREVVRVIRVLPIPATVVFLLCCAGALFLGRPWLWRTVAGIGLSLVAAGILALLARAIAGHEIVDRLLKADTYRGAVDAAWGIFTSEVVDLAVAAIGLGVLVALGAFLMSDAGPATELRRRLGGLLRRRDASAGHP